MTGSRVVLLLVGLLAAAVLVLLLVLGLPEGGAPPESATPSGGAINDIYWAVFVITAAVFVLVEGALLLFIFRFRRRSETPEDVEGPQIHGNTRVEVAWTLVPVLLLVAITAFVFLRLPTVHAAPAEGEAGDAAIRVTAHQFYWQYEYPNGALSFDVLYLPVDRHASLTLESADVVHSWWVPELTGKRDAVPGRTNVLNFEPTRTGTFENGKCGEFCGIQHARMLTRVEVLPQEEYERWLAENAPDRADEEALGKAEWTAACAKCHGAEGEGDIGPPIAGNGTLREADALRRLLFEGQDLDGNPGYMPPVGRGWSDRQIAALIAYVEATPALAEPPAGGESDGG